eukprot:s739_g20.t1
MTYLVIGRKSFVVDKLVKCLEISVQLACELLIFDPRLESKKTPGHSDMDQVDDTEGLNAEMDQVFRTCLGVLLYLASDLPHCQHVVCFLATYSTRPSQKSLVVLKHLVGHLASHENVCVSLKWKGRNMGIYHPYELPRGDAALEKFSKTLIGHQIEVHDDPFLVT